MRVSFAGFEFDSETGELARDGSVVRLQAQVADALALLVARAGRLVRRDELYRHLWPDTVVEYDQGLNNTIRLLRRALGDDAERPRFVETVPRRGYRFVAAVRSREPEVETTLSERAPSDAAPGGAPPPARDGRHATRLALALAAAALTVAVAGVWRGRPSAAPALPTVAVLPFAGEGEAHAAIGTSLAQELTRELSVVPGAGLRVIGQDSAERAARDSVSPEAAGRRLGASHLVRGTLGERGDGLSLEVALLRVADGGEMWSYRRRVSWRELLVTQRALASEIATRVGETVGSRPAPRPPSAEPEAVESYLRARYLGSRGRWSEAVPLLRAAIATDPAFVAGRVALGEALLNSSEGLAVTAEARELAAVALRMAPDDAEAHLLRARVALTGDWDWRLAEAHLARATELAAERPAVHLARAVFLSSLARHREALAAAELARELDPLSTTVQGDLAMLHFWASDWEGVQRESERLLELEPDAPVARSLRLEALLRRGEWGPARTLALAQHREYAPLREIAGPELHPHLLELQESRWRQADPGPARAMVLASLAAQRGRAADALSHLDDAIRLRSSYVPFLATDPHFASLAASDAFQERLARVGHPLARSRPPSATSRASGS